jgi:hypothetical protein
MPINLSEIKPTRAILPPRLVVYGPPKIGKTTLLASIPEVLILDVEGGSGALDVARVEKDRLTTLGDVHATLDALLTQDHSFAAVGIDSADWLEALIGRQIAAEAGKVSLEDIPYQAGHKKLPELWKHLFAKLNTLRERKGMAIIFIAHDCVKTYNDPLSEAYDRHQLKMHRQSSDILTEWADCLFFANQTVHLDKKNAGFNRTIVKGKAGDRVLHTVESPAYQAGNRYGLPEELPLSWAAFIDAFNATMEK